MAFDILSLQRNRGQQAQAKSKAAEQGQRVELKYIDVRDLVPSKDNFYSMPAIEELAEAIELAGGVKQPALVVPLGGGKYKVLAGHRRRLASIMLVEQGKTEYQFVPCVLDEAPHTLTESESGPGTEGGETAEDLQGINEQILIIVTNCQREKTDWDKVEETTRLRDLLARKRKFEKVPGKTRDLIAEALKTTPAQVGRYESVAKHLIPEFQAALKGERVNISVAYELSTLPEADQKAAFAEFEGKGALSIEDVKRRREPKAPEQDQPKSKAPQEEAETPLPGQIDFDGGTVTPEDGNAQKPQDAPSAPEPPQERGDEEVEQEPAAPPPAPVTSASGPQEPENPRPEETRCIDAGICPHCGERFDAAESVNYRTTGTQETGPVACPHCGKLVAIFCSVEYFCSVPEE